MDKEKIDVPKASALSKLISKSDIYGYIPKKSPLSIEILYNLKYQHGWDDLSLHSLSSGSATKVLDSSPVISVNFPIGLENVTLISGVPPRHSYIHPDLQSHLIKDKISESDIEIQREWVLPVSLGEKWTLRKFNTLFNALPQRDPLQRVRNSKNDNEMMKSETEKTINWRDSKRVLLGMLAHTGKGGDGTVVYYIMQEGEVKPRQNG